MLVAVEHVAAETCRNFYLCLLAFLSCVLNTKVVLNFVIWVLTNFQHYSIIVQKVRGQILQLGLLENSQDREAETKFFDPPNCKISSRDEYQKCRRTDYLSSVKSLEHLDERNVRYEISCDRQRFCQSVILIVRILSLAIVSFAY